ncbi:amidohydrolase [Mangrovibacterium marinum]|uniref:L-fuconolactonase n=1 Tax=Mangrovibacterium marinum TaxID=1639118 RepID=A0A2T5BZS8_9BACT|nr:amidohydrolase family protein [Mangrovibacterium marinum]PTN07788.1 L-fuconolactonase [Mangrovibacterium marinum]
MIIDTHHHFWNFNPVEFDWIDDKMATIRRSFLPHDLAATLKGTEVQAVVTVQARQCVDETDWLLKLAHENELIQGVVGWLPLAAENIDEWLEKYRSNNWLKAVRHVVQGEPDPEFVLGKAFNRGVNLLNRYSLVYDILIFDHQLPNTIRFVDQHPDQQFVLDHLAKPRIREGELEPWASEIRKLAERENVSCKLSGMVTEARYKTWTDAQLEPYLDVVLEAFGPKRLLYGSDWPVCLVATQYADWLSVVKKKLARLTANEQDLILYKNARRVYQL